MSKEVAEHSRSVYLAMLGFVLLLFGLSMKPRQRDEVLMRQELGDIARNMSNPKQIETAVQNDADFKSRIFTEGYVTPAETGRFQILGCVKCPPLQFEIRESWFEDSLNQADVATFNLSGLGARGLRSLDDFSYVWNWKYNFVRIPRIPDQFDATLSLSSLFFRPAVTTAHLVIHRVEVPKNKPNCRITIKELGPVTSKEFPKLDSVDGTLMIECYDTSISYTMTAMKKIRTEKLKVSVRSGILRVLNKPDDRVHWYSNQLAPAEREFEDAFPELVGIQRRMGDRDLSNIVEELNRQSSTETQEELPGGIKVGPESIPILGVIVLLAMQFYLFSNLVELRRLLSCASSGDWSVPFVCLYPQRMTRVAVVISLALLPVISLGKYLVPDHFPYHPWLYGLSLVLSLFVGIWSAKIVWVLVAARDGAMAKSA